MFGSLGDHLHFGGDVKPSVPGRPGLISLRLFQAFVSHYYSGKPEG